MTSAQNRRQLSSGNSSSIQFAESSFNQVKRIIIILRFLHELHQFTQIWMLYPAKADKICVILF